MKYRLSRIEPPDGYLKTYTAPITYEEILKDVIATYAGGKYRLEYIDGASVKAKTFSLVGKPAKKPKCSCNSSDLFMYGCRCGGA